VFYTRLGQRIIHILDTRMAMGQLYEVDMRLRPSGESGMLVISSAGFRRYQEQDAWTWEHQALVRARFVAGDVRVAEQVESIRMDILCKPRDLAVLTGEVSDMRTKMRDKLLPQKPSGENFHLKQDRGGIVDIEFMVQYAVLAWSSKQPSLARWSDNVRILEALGAAGYFKPEECDELAAAYIAFRSAAHQRALQQQSDLAPAQQFLQARAAVTHKWQQLFGPEAIQ
jgi:glutamate-ammonia-ligase adenylyltransferase